MEVGNFVEELGHGAELPVSVNLFQRGFCTKLRVEFVVMVWASKQSFAVMLNDFFLNYNSVISALLNRKY